MGTTLSPSYHPCGEGDHHSFGALKQIDAGVLHVGYAEAGPTDGPAVILLHGWPYDIYSYVDVAPWLASAGYRVIVPYLRGYGTTRFLAHATPLPPLQPSAGGPSPTPSPQGQPPGGPRWLGRRYRAGTLEALQVAGSGRQGGRSRRWKRPL